MLTLCIKWGLLSFAIGLASLVITPLIEWLKIQFDLSINVNYYLTVLENFCITISLGCLAIGIGFTAVAFWQLSQRIK